MVDRVAKLVLFVAVAEADDSPAPTLMTPSNSYTGEKISPNSCVTHGHWFSSISHFAMFTKSINDALSPLGHSHYSSFKSNALATGCF